MTKPTWIVCDMEGFVQCNDDTVPVEYKTEAAAIKAAEEQLKTSGDDERWVYKLTHVISREITTDVQPVK